MEGLLGRKLGMTQVFDQMGRRVPVTVIETGPCVVMDKSTKAGDGSTNVQLAFDECREKVLNKPKVANFEKKGVKPHRVLREFRVDPETANGWDIGASLTVDTVFRKGDYVDVSGKSKGCGFTGVMKRYGFKGAKASHGAHEYFRHGGSIGSSADPARVFKGTRMPGQHGGTRVTTQNLEVMSIFADKNLLLVRGSVPGPPQGLVEIRHAVKKSARVSEKV